MGAEAQTVCEYINVALGRSKADLVIKDPKIVDVNTREVYCSDIVIKKGRIVSIGDSSDSIGKGTLVIKGNEMYAVPGFIDAHIHVESSMLTLSEFSGIAAQHGTTSILWDPHELVNVVGLLAFRVIIQESEKSPIHVFLMVPSCVPSAPGIETSGARLTTTEVAKALKMPNVLGLGEVMNFPGVLSCSAEVIQKIELARRMNAIIDGHAPGLAGKMLAGYVASGVRSDHECVSQEEGLARLRSGMWLMIRESSTSKDLGELVKPLVKGIVDTRHCMLVSDDRSVTDLLAEGHMDHIVRRAISEGMDVLTAYQLVTINPATYMRMENEIGNLAPGRIADVVLLKDLTKVEIQKVIIRGRESRPSLSVKKTRYPGRLTSSVRLKKHITPSDLTLRSRNTRAEIKVIAIGLREGTLLTSREERQLLSVDGVVSALGDTLHAAVIERHHRTGNIGKGFVTGFGALKGAIAQTISHDSHNLIVIGSNPNDMANAVHAVARLMGGIALSFSGKIMASMKLPIAGLMSIDAADSVAEQKMVLEAEARRLGAQAKAPITALSFLALPVIPEIKLTDKGLFDVGKGKFIKPIVK